MNRRLALIAAAALVFAACSGGDPTVSSADGIPAATEAIEDVPDTAATSDDAEEAADEQEVAPEESVVEESVLGSAALEPVTASTVPETTSDDFPDILAAQATPDGNGSWRFDVTVSSTYDTPERYADAWRVVGPDGTEFGIRVLTHDHANEQPFTRSQSGIAIPADVTTVTVEGRDLANGWGGGTLVVDLAPSA